MSNVPSWAQLRHDANIIANLQDQCYRSVHHLLDSAIPELDRKLQSLKYARPRVDRGRSKTSAIIPTQSIRSTLIATTQPDYSTKEIPHPREKSQVPPAQPPEDCITVVQYPRHHNEDVAKNSQKSFIHVPYISENSVHVDMHTENDMCKFNNAVKDGGDIISTKFDRDPKARVKSKPSKKSSDRFVNNHKKEFDLDKLEHLKSLPMPLSEYLKINRPDLVHRANERVMYLKRKSERRKHYAHSRIISSLERIKLSNKSTGRNINQQEYQHRDYLAPEYHVKYRLSEQEMKRLTARIYKRLPEVKRQRRDQESNYMKVQNYKNKLEYGRKLLENRRQGIINYPLRSSNDDSRSINSSVCS